MLGIGNYLYVVSDDSIPVPLPVVHVPKVDVDENLGRQVTSTVVGNVALLLHWFYLIISPS